MPITPLHLALGFPAKQALGEKISMKSFIAANIAIDIQPVLSVFLDSTTDFRLELHGLSHTLLGATSIALFLGAIMTAWLKNTGQTLRPYWVGLFYGVWSHLLLDATVHSDVLPFWPLYDKNTLNIGQMEKVSLVCFVVTCAYLVPWLLGVIRAETRK